MRSDVKRPPPAKTECDRAYHVDWNETFQHWDVTDEDGRVHTHCNSVEAATASAIREAHRVHGAGADVSVCVQQQDGTYRLAWFSA